jgi:mono/diheme cytochrome c family protein
MKSRILLFAGILTLVGAAFAADPAKGPNSNANADPPVVTGGKPGAAASTEDADAIRTEGEKRFRANCSRCHAAPHKFPPRMMATFVRHMRVRATITNEDMRYILAYMTQ